MGKIPDERPRGRNRTGAANHTRSPGSYCTWPGIPAQYRVLMPEHEQLDILRPVTAEP